MNEHQVVLTIEGLETRILELEQESDALRQVLNILLDKAQLDPEERETLHSLLEIVVAEEVEEGPRQAKSQRSIQDLLDESQKPKQK
jgi:regulator of replication initiation timing